MNRYFKFLPLLLITFLTWPTAAAQLPDFTGLVKQYGPAVVNISTSQTRGTRTHGFSLEDLPEDSPMREFFRHFFGENGQQVPEEERESMSLGSGFFISPDGFILTNHHVVAEADEIIVRTSDRREFTATVVGSDKRSDTALLKVDISDAPVIRVGSARDLEVGEWVLAIGSPFGFDHSVTAGIVSAKGRNLPSENYVPFIQTDVAINPGNSGGPLIDLEGKVVGVNSQIYSRTGGFMGLSFAVPIDLAMNVAEQIRTRGHVSRGWLGVMIQDVNRELAETFGMHHPKGALVAQVLPDSPAEQAGVQVGDVIVSYNGRELLTSSALPPLVGSSPVSKPAELGVLRGGQERTIQVTIGELPEEGEAKTSETPSRPHATRLGLVLRELEAEHRKELGLGDSNGILVEEVKPGPALKAGILPGDVILMLNYKTVGSVQEFATVVEAMPKDRPVPVLIQREDGRLFLALRLE
jgi:serine protease Do